jgi:hypothetical protein
MSEKSLVFTIRDENCVELLELADRHHSAELKRATLRHIKAGFRIRSGSAWIRINLSCWIQIQEGINDPQ